MRQLTQLFTIAAVVLLFSGCASTIVKQPGASSVKEIAVISVYSNRTPHGMKGAGGGGFTALAGLVKSAGADSTDSDKGFGGTRLVEFTTQTLTTELGSVEGWRVSDSNKIGNHPAYKEFSEEMNNIYNSKAGKFIRMMMVSAPNTVLYPVGQKGDSNQVSRLKKLANDLGVDAVAVVGVDLAYASSFAIGGTGTAKAAVGSSVKILNRKGEWAVLSADTDKLQENQLSKSSDSTGMVAGNILFSDSVEKMYQEAIQQDIKKTVARIKKELKG